MKRATLILALTLMFSACSNKDQAIISNNPPSSQEITEKIAESKAIGSHLCGANTTKNQPCKRKVRNDKGQFCFQHNK